ncbi:MAG: hypothetical protein ACO3RV_06780 [Luteolibacter sp.]
MAGIWRLLLVVGCGLLASCIDSREEFWIDATGGGRAEITVTIPQAATRLHGGVSGVEKMIDDLLGQVSGIEQLSRKVERVGDRVRIFVRFHFRSARDLAELGGKSGGSRVPAAVRHVAGLVKISFDGGRLNWQRRSEPGRAIPGVSWLPASALDGRLVTVIHLPLAVNESNASRIEDGGRRLVWELPLAEAVKSPVVMRFNMELPIFWSWVIGLLVLLVGFGVFFIWRRIQRKSSCGCARSVESSPGERGT